jgi:hypothetical protein
LTGTPNGTSPVPVPPCPEETLTISPLIPGTGNRILASLDPKQNPGAAVPLLLDALDRITESYDKLKSEGKISTPFSGNPEKERESVIQQTYWIYTSALSGQPYVKADFKAMTDRQFEKNTGTKADELPPAEKEKYTQGVDNFFNTFSIVGAESKVLTPVPVIPPPAIPESGFDKIDPKTMKPGSGTSTPKGTTSDDRRTTSEPTEAPTLIKDEKSTCTCGNITVEIKVTELNRQPNGKFEGPVTKQSATASADNNATPHAIKLGKKGLKKGDKIRVNLESVTVKCPCTDNTECDVFKDAKEAKAYADAVKERDKVLEDLKDDLEGANKDLADAEAELKKPDNKRKYEEALDSLAIRAQRLKKAEEDSVAFENAKQVYKAASDAYKNAKGKDARAAALAAKEAAQKALDKAKDANPTKSKLRLLRARVKAAEDQVDKMEKDVKTATEHISEINKKITEAHAKVLVIAFGPPTLKDSAGNEIKMGHEFKADKGDAKIEFTFTVSVYCTSAECSPKDCARTFVIMVEE